MSKSEWGVFWMKQKTSFNEVMKLGTTFFSRQLEKKFNVVPGTEIFDYGCGPGFLIDYFAFRRIITTGADINFEFVNTCRRNHPMSNCLEITTDSEENRKILERGLADKKFDLIVLLSIVQYFNDYKEVENVVGLLKPFLKRDGKIIIADVIDDTTSPVADVISLFKECIHRNKIPDFIKFIFYLIFSNYRRIARSKKLLKLPYSAIRDIAKKNGMSCEVTKSLSIHSSRTNYILMNERLNKFLL